MSDLMERAIIQMPFELAMQSELSRLQFYLRAQEAYQELVACRLLLTECDVILTEEGVSYCELRAFLNGKAKPADVIASLSNEEDGSHD